MTARSLAPVIPLFCRQGAHPWMLDVTEWPGDTDSYVDAMVWLVSQDGEAGL